MQFIDSAFDSLAVMSATCLVVLVIGTLLTRCWTRPIEQLRCIQATVVALVAACLLQQLHLLPQYSLGWLSSNGRIAFEVSADASSGNSGQISAQVAVTQVPVERLANNHASEGPRTTPASTERPWNSPAAGSTAPVAPTTDIRAMSLGQWARMCLVLLFMAGAACSLLSLGLGLWRLRRLVRNSVQVPARIIDSLAEIQGGRTRLVPVLSSSEIDVPLTFGAIRPTIVLSDKLARFAPECELRECLAHEWAHIHSGDIVWWWAMQAIQPLVWIQPLYWTLRRELRLRQDQMADHFAAGRACDSVSYAELLMSLATARPYSRTGMALTMNDGRSSLFRRVQWLLSANRQRLATCRTRVTCVATVVLVALTSALGVVNFGRAEPADSSAGDKPMTATSPTPAARAQDSKPASEGKAMPADVARKTPVAADKSKITFPASVMGEERPDGSLFYSGEIVDKTTKAPIKGATVTVRRSIEASFERKILEETKHTTDEHGKYSFVIPPKQVAEKYLYIELDVEHPDYASKTRFGYALDMIRKNARFNDPPFFYHVELDPGAELTGRIVGPDGKPLADVPMMAYSNVNPRDFSNDNYGTFIHAKSAADGTFRLSMTKTGPSVFWIVPLDFAPRQIVSDTKRGEWGDITMATGVGLKGQVVDATGKPIAGVWVNVTDEKSQAEIQMPVASQLARSGQADAEGRFEIGPLKPGPYRLTIADYPEEIRYHAPGGSGRDRKRMDIPAVFVRRAITIGPKMGEPIIVRAVPHVRFEAQYFDSKGKHRSGHEPFVFGKLDGEFYNGHLQPTADGQITGLLPHGLEDTQLQLMTNEHSALRIRLGKDKPLLHGRDIKLGTLEADITGVEIIRYTAPIVLLKAVDEDGQPIPKVKVAAIYESDEKDKLVRPVDNLPTSIFFEKQPGGIFRTSQMLPDEKTKFVASAEGYQDAQETLSMPEGETRELKLVLKRANESKPAPPEKKAGE
jgi:beta-lactamase regulating signal transducer with metallopeptidase domain